MARRPDDPTPGYEDNAALRGFGGYEPADAPRARPQRIRPASKPLKWRRAPWFGLVFIALVAGVLNALGVGKPRPASSSPPPAPLVVTPSPRVSVPALISGWQPVAARDGSYAYDVPPAWTPKPGTLHGWDEPSIRLITSAFLGENFCGKDDLGGAGVTTSSEPDPEAAARKAVTDLATGAYGGTSQAGPGTDAEVTKADGTKAPARVVVAEVAPAATGECAAKHALVVAMGFGGSGGSGVVVAYADSDRSGPSIREDLVKIVESYRFVPAADRGTTIPPPTTYR
ncbi:hypothetical protein SAMN05421837_10859 [Amycolatopsis pretoriensis]|uniref:DUF8017 domain-containing protein n=1 Tax=Amycolatopsis pretoriensis TaxID=218821 RepID=A0A1H5RAL9_9PSEU|nr:hypothetical protein [Amycolatopsis pretoriensis]SEF35426.1 hypothetical protein SAMN05421837_10859 [Amycolatopsis pretoriensis]